MPRYILRPVNGARPYVLIDIDAAGGRWWWRRLDETGQYVDVADQTGHEPTREEALSAALKRFGAGIFGELPNDDTGIEKLREYNASWNA